jgi:hypothetical protein
MSKTHSQSISKETGYSAALVVGLLLYVVTIIILLSPGLIELLTPAKSTVGTDPIDKATVNEAIKYIQPE